MPKAKVRKDNRGRILKQGEGQRKDNGLYYFQYTDSNGARRTKYAKDLPSLRAIETALLKDQFEGIDSYSAETTTLNQAFDRYIATKLSLKEHTRTNYKYMYNHCVRDSFGNRLLSSIRYSDVKFFYYSLLNTGNLKANTLDIIQTVLHPTFGMAVRDGIIRMNPTDGVMSEIRKEFGNDADIRHALTLKQQRAFLNYIEASPVFNHWHPFFVFLFGTGCRIGEAVGIRWKDLDYEKRLISINHTIVYRVSEYGKCGFHVSTPKTKAGIRTIPMMDMVYEALQQEHEYQEEYGFNIDQVDGMNGFLFCNKNGKLLNPQQINTTIKRIYETYNGEEILKAKKEHREPVLIPHFSCHHIRHTFCTRMCENETNLKVIQDIMGHANIETTMDIYAEATEEKKKSAIAALENSNNIF